MTGKESEVAEAKKQLEQIKAKTQDLETKLTASNTKVRFLFKRGEVNPLTIHYFKKEIQQRKGEFSNINLHFTEF